MVGVPACSKGISPRHAPLLGLRIRIRSLSLAFAWKLVTYRFPSGPKVKPSGRCRSTLQSLALGV